MFLTNHKIAKNLNHKAFTILEFLMVIVVLAIIALIAVPIIRNKIENSRKNAAVTSAKNYIKTVEKYIEESKTETEVEKLEQGQKYNVTKTTQIGEKTYKAINEVVQTEEAKPEGSEDFILIGEKDNVTAATLTVNGYEIVIKENSVKGIIKMSEKTMSASPYSVGSVYVSTENVNPSAQFGGTWQLIDKEFASLHKYCDTPGQCTEYFTPTENMNLLNIMVLRHGNTIRIRFYFNNLVMLADTAIPLGTLNFSALGLVSPLYYGLYNQLAGSDDGNGAAMLSMNYSTGIITSVDVVGKSSTIAANSHLAYDFIYDVPMYKMKDEACDKFYWKRVS